jgi:uncharacterized protein YutE (UPF0331/DUF86 family)
MTKAHIEVTVTMTFAEAAMLADTLEPLALRDGSKEMDNLADFRNALVGVYNDVADVVMPD